MMKYLFVYRSSIFAALVSWGALFVMQTYRVPLVFLLTLAGWMAILVSFLLWLETKVGKHRQHLNLLVLSIIAFTGIMSLIELTELRQLLSVIVSLAIGGIFAMALQEVHAVRFQRKRWRRLLVVLWAFLMFAMTTTLYALALFFPHIPHIVFAACIALMGAYSAYTIWRLYMPDVGRQHLLWMLFIGFLLFELAWVSFVLPFGYLALGFQLVWFWYLAQLLIRFHLSPRGIEWRKQWTFLIGNGIVYCLILFGFISWI